MSLPIGASFSKYRIDAHLARGGTGDVYRAVDTQTGMNVALKIPTKEASIDPAKFEFFLREIDALGVLHHPAVQCLVESGREKNTAYLVTALIEGMSLRKLLKQAGHLPVDRSIALTCKLADALAYCHHQNVIHCDLKPENILLDTDDQPTIIDFGLALTNTRPTLRTPAGTPDYMSPEQIQDRSLDCRTDIYSLGIILYEMLAGSVPYTSDNPAVVVAMHLYETLPRLDKVNPDISLQVASVVARCLHRNPDMRYADMLAVKHDLSQLEQVNPMPIDEYCQGLPKPTIFENQIVRSVVLSVLIMVGIVALGFALAALKK